MKVNEGEVPQYYVENSHPAIIAPEEFDAVQAEFLRRKSLGRRYSGQSILSARIVCSECSECGDYYGSKVWHSNTKYRRTIWQCNSKFDHHCTTPSFDEEDVKERFLMAYNQLAKEQMQLNGTPSVFLPPDIIYDNTQATLAETLGSEYHVATQTVRKYAVYASMIDQLYDTEPAFAKKILQGEIHIGHESLAEVTAMNAGELTRLCKYFLESTECRPSYTKYKTMLESGKKKPQKQPPSAGSIKEMPEYDPDSEVSSLTLTIPSWIGSIQRAERNSDFSKITERAREKLIAELINLIHIADNTIISLKEKRHG